MVDENFNLVSLVALLVKKAGLIILAGLLFAFAFFYYSSKKPNLYRSSSVIVATSSLELDRGESNISLSNLFLQKANNGGVEIFQLMLKSYVVAKKVGEILKDELMAKYPALFPSSVKYPPDFVPTEEDLINALRQCVFVQFGDAGNMSLRVSIDTQEPGLSKRILETYMTQLEISLNEIHLKVVTNNESYYMSQIKKNQRQFLEDSTKLAHFDRAFDVRSGSSTVDVDLKHDDMAKPQENGSKDDVVSNIPSSVYLEYLLGRKMVLQTINSALEQQFQMSRLEIDQRWLLYHVIEPPNMPKGPFKPNRKMLSLMGFFTGITLGILGVFLYTYCCGIKSEFLQKLPPPLSI